MKRVTREEVLQLAGRAGLNGQNGLSKILTGVAGGMTGETADCYGTDRESGEKLLKATIIETGVGS